MAQVCRELLLQTTNDGSNLDIAQGIALTDEAIMLLLPCPWQLSARGHSTRHTWREICSNARGGGMEGRGATGPTPSSRCQKSRYINRRKDVIN